MRERERMERQQVKLQEEGEKEEGSELPFCIHSPSFQYKVSKSSYFVLAPYDDKPKPLLPPFPLCLSLSISQTIIPISLSLSLSLFLSFSHLSVRSSVCFFMKCLKSISGCK